MNPCQSLFFTAESSVWRSSKISCSKIFNIPRKHLWWSLFISQNDYLKIDDKVDSYGYFCENLPEFIQRVTISQKIPWMQSSKIYRPISTLVNTCQILLVQSKCLRSSKYFNYNLELTEILKIIKHHMVKTTFKIVRFW